MRKNFMLLGMTLITVILVVVMGCTNPTSYGSGSGGGEIYDYTSENIGTLKYVPVGSFQRDTTSTNISIISKPYRMSEHEITRQQFLDIMGDDPSDTVVSDGFDHPVQKVNWYHSIAFCNKLSLAEGLEVVYSVTVSGSEVDWENLDFEDIPTTDNSDWNGADCDWEANGYRLPTEMEWMWAAMGAEDDYEKAFSGDDGSNSIGDYTVYGYHDDPKDDGQTTTMRSNSVGSKNVNELGLADMSGNVWEWCWDWKDSYPTGEVIDYQGAASDTQRAVRGGSWYDSASDCTVSNRSSCFPKQQRHYYGFRVVRS